MRLIIGQLPIKAGWIDAHVAPWNLGEGISKTLSTKKPIAINGLSSKFDPSLRRAGSV